MPLKQKKKVLMTAGIRPDGNKMSPLYLKFKENSNLFDTVFVNTGQHTDLLSEMLRIFKVKEDYSLKSMVPGESSFDLINKMIQGVSKAIEKEKPDLVFAPNDGTTTFVTALCAYFHKIPVAHVEAGLRTYDIYNPFPEEGNRKMTSAITSYHFAPTPRAKENLLKENVSKKSIFTTGNTVIDALIWVKENFKNYVFKEDILNKLDYKGKKIVVLTTHRRENWGKPMKEALQAIKELVKKHKDIEVVFPVHTNPFVQEVAQSMLQNKERIHLVSPQSYIPFVLLQSRCYMLISDSGGIQEEAPTFGKPVLVMRKTTERPEGVEAGVAKLVGTDGAKIFSEASKLISSEKAYKQMSKIKNPYGDGKASDRILDAVSYVLGVSNKRPSEFKPKVSSKI